MAAYDPIFYLHHTYVDRLYAFWQELQKLRGLSSLTAQQFDNSPVRDFQMPPYKNQIANPFFEVTGKNSSQAYGLNYQENYCYRYDNLIFNGTTPEQFYQTDQCGDRVLVSVLPRTTNKLTSNNIIITGTTRTGVTVTIENAFVTMEKPWPYDDDFTKRNPLLIDVTEYTTNMDLNTLDFQVKSYDENGTEVDNVFKPISEYVSPNGTRQLKIFVDQFSSYPPVMRFCNLDTTVEFLNRDGTYNQEVYQAYNQGNETVNRNVSNPVEIISRSNTFGYNGTTINIGYDPSCHVRVSFSLF